MKAVLDTNVWLDWLVFDDPSTHPLQAAADFGLLELPASAGTRDEWLDVIARPQFGLDADAREAIIARYARLVTLVVVQLPAPHPTRAPGMQELLCRDPDDQKFLELALTTGARFLVTRDRALLDLARRAQRQHALTILRPDAPAWIAALADCVSAARGPADL